MVSIDLAPRETEIVDLGRYRELKNSCNSARKKISTCIHFEISAAGQITTLTPVVDPRDVIAVIAWCTELANQMFDIYYTS